MKLFKMYLFVILIFMLLLDALPVVADGSFIDKVYHPYVQENERELEWRWLYTKDNENSEESK